MEKVAKESKKKKPRDAQSIVSSSAYDRDCGKRCVPDCTDSADFTTECERRARYDSDLLDHRFALVMRDAARFPASVFSRNSIPKCRSRTRSPPVDRRPSIVSAANARGRKRVVRRSFLPLRSTRESASTSIRAAGRTCTPARNELHAVAYYRPFALVHLHRVGAFSFERSSFHFRRRRAFVAPSSSAH